MDEISKYEVKRLWEELREHRAWKWLEEVAKGQIENRSGVVLSQMALGEELEREFFKGEIAGIRTFLSIPQTAIEIAESEIAQEKENEN